MARDYKHRANPHDHHRYSNHPQRRRKESSGAIWRWLLIIGLVVAFVVFLNMIRKMLPELLGSKEAQVVQPETKIKQEQAPKPTEAEKKSADTPVEPEEPRYDFYTLLPQAEVVVPDYEIKTRVREQLVGKTKVAKYAMQAGSFRELVDAERHKAKLALLGIEAKIEKAKVGNVIWHRIKIGPYDNPASVSTIKDLLQKNGIGVVITESNQ